MKAEQVKVSPAGAETILRYILEETLARRFFSGGNTEEIRVLAKKAASAMPEDYLPDTYLDIALSGDSKPVIAFA